MTKKRNQTVKDNILIKTHEKKKGVTGVKELQYIFMYRDYMNRGELSIGTVRIANKVY
jgi:hypothetical protein